MFYIQSIQRVKGIQGLSHFPIMIIIFRDECFFFGQRECRKQCLFIHLLIIILPKNQLFCVYLCHIADTLTHHYTSSMWLTLEFVRHQLAKFMICIILQDWRGNIKSLKLANLSRETNSINKIQKNLSLFTSV